MPGFQFLLKDSHHRVHPNVPGDLSGDGWAGKESRAHSSLLLLVLVLVGLVAHFPSGEHLISAGHLHTHIAGCVTTLPAFRER